MGRGGIPGRKPIDVAATGAPSKGSRCRGGRRSQLGMAGVAEAVVSKFPESIVFDRKEGNLGSRRERATIGRSVCSGHDPQGGEVVEGLGWPRRPRGAEDPFPSEPRVRRVRDPEEPEEKLSVRRI